MGSRNLNPNPNPTRNRNRNRKKNLKRRAPSSSSSSSRYGKQLLKFKVDIGPASRRRFSRPFKIGRYDSGTEPHRIPYHLYLLVKEAVVLMQRGLDSALVDRKINFFCQFFYSHLPVGWKYDKDNAAFLIASYDTTLPKYNISGYTPLRTLVYQFDAAIRLSVSQVLDLMSIIHKRKTPTPETFMRWDENLMSFYCKLCSCFGIDYLHLEAASEDDVLLMTRSESKSSVVGGHKPYLKWVEKISPNKDVRTVLYNNVINMPKLSSSDEAFALSTKEILGSCVLLFAHRGYLLSPRLLDGIGIKYRSIPKCVPTFCVDYHRFLEADA